MKLNILNGKIKRSSFDIGKEAFFIGRSDDNDILIKDPSVSRKHAKIIRKGDRYYIVDLQSRNGTRLEGHLLTPGDHYEVPEGITISIGETLFSIESNELDAGMVTKCSINLAGMLNGGSRNILYKDRRITSRRNLELLYEVSSVLMHTLDINRICEEIMKAIFYCLNRVDNGSVLLLDSETGRIYKAISMSRDGARDFEVNYSRTVVNRVISEGRAVIMSDTGQEDESNLSDSIEMMNIKSIMCVPLICKSKVKGVIYVHSVNVPNGFRKDDLSLFAALSSPAALAIENSLAFAARKRAERTLQASEEKYRLLVDNLNDAVFVVRNGWIKYVNRTAADLLGYSLKGLIGTKFMDLFKEKDREIIAKGQQGDIVGEGKSENKIFELINNRDKTMWVSLDETRIRWERRPALLYCMRDISKEKRLEYDMIQNHKMESYHTLAGGLSHELNNLLMGIQGNVSLMMFDIDNDNPHYRRLRNIEGYIDKASRITENLFGGTLDGRYITGDCDLNQVVSQAAEDFGRSKDNIEISLRLEKDLPAVEACPKEVEKMLMKLFQNSWEAISGKGEICVETRNITFEKNEGQLRGVREGDYAMITVSDTGIGMDDKTRMRIFDPYFKANKKGEGLGLGLSVVYSIVKNHKGGIEVTSKEGKGSSFSVFLPSKAHSL